MLVPSSWQNAGRNLQAALLSSIAAGDFWARSRGLKYLRFVHRLDAETTGVLLLAKSQGALHTYSELFESRKMEKLYLAVVHGAPRQAQWSRSEEHTSELQSLAYLVCRLLLEKKKKNKIKLIFKLNKKQ